MLLLQFISASSYLLKDPVALNIEQASQWSLMLKGFGFLVFGLSKNFVLPTAAEYASRPGQLRYAEK
jgi:hypothetical protein